MNWFLFVLASFATFRSADMLVNDTGPFHLFKWWRNLWKKRPLLHELFTCIFCVSGYVALNFVALLWLIDEARSPNPLLVWFAIWGGAIFIFRILPER